MVVGHLPAKMEGHVQMAHTNIHADAKRITLKKTAMASISSTIYILL